VDVCVCVLQEVQYVMTCLFHLLHLLKVSNRDVVRLLFFIQSRRSIFIAPKYLIHLQDSR
jgi:hypothetical protein